MVKDYGCDDCKFLKGKRCKLWQVRVNYPHESHCESIYPKGGLPAKTEKTN